MIGNKTKKIILVILPLGALIQLFGAILYGMHEKWFRFGLSLTVCVIMMTFYTSVFLAGKIDSRFNQLEKLIEEKTQNEKKEKVIEKGANKSAES